MAKNKINIVLLSYGNQVQHNRALFCILSLFAATKTISEIDKLIIYTDQPSHYQFLSKQINIDINLLNKDIIDEMKGEDKYIHRIKIKSIEHASKKYSDAVIFLDTDTFFIKDPTDLFSQISHQKSIMHEQEGLIKNINVDHNYAKKLKDRSLIHNTSEKVSELIYPNSISWNSGVVGFHHDLTKQIEYAVEICDEIYHHTKIFTSEQIAFSLVLAKTTKILKSNEYVYHYWNAGRKKAVDEILNGLLTKTFYESSFEIQLAMVSHHLEGLSEKLEKHPYFIETSAIQAVHRRNYTEGLMFFISRIICNRPVSLSFYKDIYFAFKNSFAKL